VANVGETLDGGTYFLLGPFFPVVTIGCRRRFRPAVGI
jgi:hypothetical protein